ncbi:MAG TPA: hypothetical protein VFQ61_33660 [Polyangiaceae bacterium]|nr:hypothetical protein [Polyangiaceae bacterium]
MLVLSLVLQGSVGYSRTARAETGSPQQRGTEPLVRRGLELRRAHRDSEALSAFKQAFAEEPTPMVRAQIALAEQALGQWLAADRDLSATLENPDAWVQAHRAVLEKALGVIRSHLGLLEVVTNEPNLMLIVDDELVGTLPSAPKRLLPGRHVIRLRGPNGTTREVALDLSAEERLTYHVEWPKSETAPVTNPTAAAPAPPVPTRALPPRADRKLRPQPAERPSQSQARTIVGSVAAGIALAALVEGVAATLIRENYVKRYNSPECYPIRSEQCATQRDIARDLERVALLSYLVAGTAGASSLALFAWPLIGGSQPQGHSASGSIASGSMAPELVAKEPGDPGHLKPANTLTGAQLVLSGQF